MTTLSPTSVARLKGVHPDLVRVIQRAAKDSPISFQVSEGVRTLARQKELFAQKKTQTMNSRHLDGHAVDLVVLNPDGSANWDFTNYFKLAVDVKHAASNESVLIEWGGDWKSFRDGPHFQLPFSKYP